MEIKWKIKSNVMTPLFFLKSFLNTKISNQPSHKQFLELAETPKLNYVH